MIIWGIRSFTRVYGRENRTCQFCGVTCAHTLIVVRRIFTFFFIPLIPLGTNRFTVCTSCTNRTKLHGAAAVLEEVSQIPGQVQFEPRPMKLLGSPSSTTDQTDNILRKTREKSSAPKIWRNTNKVPFNSNAGLKILVAGFVLIAGISTALALRSTSGPSPSSIFTSMKKWFGDKNLQVLICSHPLCKSSVFGGASGDFDGSKGKIEVVVLFFRTAFDENAFLDKRLQGFYPSSANYSGAEPVCIGKGFVALLGYPSEGANPSEGVVINWMTSTFGSVPNIQISAKQSWTNTLPPLTYSDFGRSGPS